MTTAVAPLREMRNEISRYTPRMVEMVGGRGADEYVQRQLGLAMLVIRDNDALQRCTPESIATALVRICGWKLEVGRTAHLVPFKGQCVAIVAWQGLSELMIRAGHVRDVYPGVVYQHDHFRLVEGTEKRLEHEPALVADRGEIVGFYAVARLKFGYTTFEYMTKAEVDKVRARAPMPNSPLWRDHYVEAGKKTALRRLAKRMPQSTATLDSALADDEAIGGAYEVAPSDTPTASPTLARRAPMQALGAGGDAYGSEAAAPTGARVEVPARVVTTPPAPTHVPDFAGMDTYDDRDLHPENYTDEPSDDEPAPARPQSGAAGETMHGGKVSDAFALDDARPVRRGRDALREG